MQLNTVFRHAKLDQLNTDFGGGTLTVRSGAKPASADSAATGTVLATVTLPVTAFAAAGAGQVLKSGTWDDNAIDASGVAGYYQIVKGTNVMIGTITATSGGGDMEVDDVNFVLNGVFTITAFTVTLPE